MNNNQESTHNELPDAFALFKPSWEGFKRNFETFIWQLLLPTALIGLTVFAGVITFAIDNAIIFGLFAVVAVAALCLSIICMSALILTELASAKHQTLGFRKSLRETLPFVWRLVGLFIVCMLIMGIGFILLIVPGLFAMQRLLLAPYILVDQNTGVFEAMRRSWRLGKKHSSPIWGVVGIVVGINLVSWIPFVGWFMSLALTIMYLCAPVIRYFQVKKHPTPVPSPPVET